MSKRTWFLTEEHLYLYDDSGGAFAEIPVDGLRAVMPYGESDWLNAPDTTRRPASTEGGE